MCIWLVSRIGVNENIALCFVPIPGTIEMKGVVALASRSENIGTENYGNCGRVAVRASVG